MRRVPREWLLPSALTLTVMLASCQPATGAKNGAPVTNPPAGGPPITATEPPPAPAPIGDAAAGKVVYENACAKCHDVDGTGQTRSGRMFGTPDLHGLLERRTDEQLIANITNGVGKMEAFGSQLSADEIQNVVAYMRELVVKH